MELGIRTYTRWMNMFLILVRAEEPVRHFRCDVNEVNTLIDFGADRSEGRRNPATFIRKLYDSKKRNRKKKHIDY